MWKFFGNRNVFNYAAAAAKPEHLSVEDDSTVVFQVPKWRKHQLRVFMCVRAADTDIAGTYIYIIHYTVQYIPVYQRTRMYRFFTVCGIDEHGGILKGKSPSTDSSLNDDETD